jgi:hypothetical protein
MKIMRKKRNLRIAALMLLLALCLALSGCASQAQTNDLAVQPQASTAESASGEAESNTAANAPQNKLKDEDTEASWDASTATKIELNNNSATVSGSGASVSGSTVTLSQAGTYLVSGTLSDGQILVSAANDDLVHLVLGGADITNSSGAPLYASQCDKLVVTLADGTSNTLTDGGASFAYNDAANEEPNAALFSKDDLTLNGTGSLIVNASFNNGIGTKDDLVIVSGNLTVSAANHGVKGNDSVRVVGAS